MQNGLIPIKSTKMQLHLPFDWVTPFLRIDPKDTAAKI